MLKTSHNLYTVNTLKGQVQNLKGNSSLKENTPRFFYKSECLRQSGEIMLIRRMIHETQTAYTLCG